MAILMVAILIGGVINPQLEFFTGVMENNSPSNTPTGIFDNVRLAIPLVVVIMAVGILIWFVASVLSQEREYQVFSRAVGVNTW